MLWAPWHASRHDGDRYRHVRRDSSPHIVRSHRSKNKHTRATIATGCTAFLIVYFHEIFLRPSVTEKQNQFIQNCPGDFSSFAITNWLAAFLWFDWHFSTWWSKVVCYTEKCSLILTSTVAQVPHFTYDHRQKPAMTKLQGENQRVRRYHHVTVTLHCYLLVVYQTTVSYTLIQQNKLSYDILIMTVLIDLCFPSCR